MAVAGDKLDGKAKNLFKLPFRSSSSSSYSSSSASAALHTTCLMKSLSENRNSKAKISSSSNVSAIARSLLPTRRRLKLDPADKLYFPYEPGNQVRSAIKIKNTSKSHVAFKFQTTSPKSCFMRPPGGILAPGESIIATVFKFIEHPENNEKPTEHKSKVKFKIVSLKVKGDMDYVPELFDQQKDHVAQEQILRVIFLDMEHPCPALEKLKNQLGEADAALEASKKPAEIFPNFIGEGLIVDEWKERREKHLALQQIERTDSA